MLTGDFENLLTAEELEQLRGIRIIRGQVVIGPDTPDVWTEPLTLDALSCLEDVESLQILYVSGFDDLEGLRSLRKADSLNLAWTSITSLRGLERVETLGELRLAGNVSLTNVDGLSGLRSAGINFIDNALLTDLDGLASLETAAMLNLASNQSLGNVDALSSWLCLGGGQRTALLCGLKRLVSSRVPRGGRPAAWLS